MLCDINDGMHKVWHLTQASLCADPILARGPATLAALSVAVVCRSYLRQWDSLPIPTHAYGQSKVSISISEMIAQW